MLSTLTRELFRACTVGKEVKSALMVCSETAISSLQVRFVDMDEAFSPSLVI